MVIPHLPAPRAYQHSRVRKLGLAAEQQRDLVEYLKSL